MCNCSPIVLRMLYVLLGHHTKLTHTKFCDKICYVLRVMETISVPDIKNLGLSMILLCSECVCAISDCTCELWYTVGTNKVYYVVYCACTHYYRI